MNEVRIVVGKRYPQRGADVDGEERGDTNESNGDPLVGKIRLKQYVADCLTLPYTDDEEVRRALEKAGFVLKQQLRGCPALMEVGWVPGWKKIGGTHIGRNLGKSKLVDKKGRAQFELYYTVAQQKSSIEIIKQK